MVDLSYFIGRPYVSLDTTLPDNQWRITLDGSAIVYNKDPQMPAPNPDDLSGTVFIRPVFSELDTRMQFGVIDAVQTEVILTPTLYTVSDPNFTSDTEIYPQVPVTPEDTLPEDPSDERVVDGPEPEADEMSVATDAS